MFYHWYLEMLFIDDVNINELKQPARRLYFISLGKVLRYYHKQNKGA